MRKPIDERDEFIPERYIEGDPDAFDKFGVLVLVLFGLIIGALAFNNF